MEPLINKPQTERGRQTLSSIVNAAVQTFYEKGYHNTSINDITKLAGVASGTFYIYFDGKYNLYKYLLLRVSHMIRRHLSKAIKNFPTRREKEREGLKVWMQFVIENPYIYGIIWESMYIDRQLFDDYYINFCKSYMEGFKECEDELADIDYEVLSYVLMGASNFIGLNWGLFKNNTTETDIDHVVDEFMKILDRGIFANQSDGGNAGKEEKHKKVSKSPFKFELPDVYDDL